AARWIATADVKSRELRQPQPRRIRELEQRAVTHGEPIVAGDGHEPCGLVRRQRGRQPARGFWRPDAGGRILDERTVVLDQEAIERAPCRERGRGASAGQRPPLAGRSE